MTDGGEFTTATRTTDAAVVLTLAGELDVATAPQALAAIRSLVLRPAQPLILDLGGLDFCDSSGIATLIAARNRALDAEAELFLAAVPEQVARLLSLTGLTALFPTRPTVEPGATARLGEPG